MRIQWIEMAYNVSPPDGGRRKEKRGDGVEEEEDVEEVSGLGKRQEARQGCCRVDGSAVQGVPDPGVANA